MPGRLRRIRSDNVWFGIPLPPSPSPHLAISPFLSFYQNLSLSLSLSLSQGWFATITHMYMVATFVAIFFSNLPFISTGYPVHKLQSRVLHLHIYDYDRFSRDDSIGEIHLPLGQVSRDPSATDR